MLAANDLGAWTRPAPGLYPHQWFWDSCFIAIGLARTDPSRAATELRHLMRGQWSDGMMPHMIYSPHLPYRLEAAFWGTGRLSPPGIHTSGITQPPMLAVAVEAVAQALQPEGERRQFISELLPGIVRFHEWIYRERDPKDTGLPACLHSWECGLDDTPYWTEAMGTLPPLPFKWRWLREFRRTRPEERATLPDLRNMLTLALRLKTAGYDSHSLIQTSDIVIQDLVFNAILVRANESLIQLAGSIDLPLPPPLLRRMNDTRSALQRLWDPQSGQYYSRDLHTGHLLRVPTIATFMPLFAGITTQDQAAHLRHLLATDYATLRPLPSVPPSSPHFEPQRFWRGPVWINTNWFIIRGLQRYGFTSEAEQLRQATLDLVAGHDFREYYHPQTGAGLGAHDFSWSAALVLDLLDDRAA